MNKIKFRMAIIVIFAFLLTALAIVQTYALFETNSSADAAFDIGQWVILLNGNDVTESRTITLSNFTYTNGVHTESNYFAPGSTVSFDLTIDASDSDVSVEYEIDIDDSDLDDYPNINFSVTNLDTNVTTATNNYTGTIMLSDQSRVVHLRINLVWTNNVLYDVSDTSLIDADMEFLITAHFTQYV